MGKHSDQRAASQGSRSSLFQRRPVTLPSLHNPWRIGLMGFLGLALLVTLVGLVLLRPTTPTSEHTSAEFSQTYALNHPEVHGTVTTVDPVSYTHL